MPTLSSSRPFSNKEPRIRCPICGNSLFFRNGTYRRAHPGPALPLSDSSADTVLLLDVLEHLDDPEKAVSEAARILRRGGTCLVQVPFLYPLHDEPHDYQRWTIHGLNKLFLRHGFQPEVSSESNAPCATAAALLSMAMAKGLLDALQKKSLPVLVAAPLIAAMVPVVNVAGLLLEWMLPESSCMPGSYLVAAKKEVPESPEPAQNPGQRRRHRHPS